MKTVRAPVLTVSYGFGRYRREFLFPLTDEAQVKAF